MFKWLANLFKSDESLKMESLAIVSAAQNASNAQMINNFIDLANKDDPEHEYVHLGFGVYAMKNKETGKWIEHDAPARQSE